MEKRLFTGGEPDLAEAALIASGVNTRTALRGYLSMIDHLCEQLPSGSHETDDVEKAKAIFDWLWKTKPKRYQPQGDFRLTKVVEAQLSKEKEEIGNCLGLTVLYNILAHRSGLAVKAAHLDDAFDRRPHVFSVLYTKESAIDIDNIFPHGFDYQGHLQNLQRKEWGSKELVADIYLSLGNSLYEQGEMERAIENYDKAIKLNPEYTRAYLNKGIALAELGRAEEASEYLNKMIKQREATNSSQYANPTPS